MLCVAQLPVTDAANGEFRHVQAERRFGFFAHVLDLLGRDEHLQDLREAAALVGVALLSEPMLSTCTCSCCRPGSTDCRKVACEQVACDAPSSGSVTFSCGMQHAAGNAPESESRTPAPAASSRTFLRPIQRSALMRCSTTTSSSSASELLLSGAASLFHHDNQASCLFVHRRFVDNRLFSFRRVPLVPFFTSSSG